MKQLLLVRRSLISVRSLSHHKLTQGAVSHDPANSVKHAENVDIAIAGGGLVGSAMALAFGKFLFWHSRHIYFYISFSFISNI